MIWILLNINWSEFLKGVFDVLIIAIGIYVIKLGIKQLKNKKPNKEQSVQVSDTTGDAIKN